MFEQNNTNCKLWACIRKLFKTFSVATYNGSDSSETVTLGTVNDLYAVVLDFSKSWRNQITIFMLYIF